jgi:hypothetical protein
MGHFVTGLIAKATVLQAFAGEHSLSWPVALTGDLAILPLREIDLASFQTMTLNEKAAGLQSLSGQLVNELRRASQREALIYFETEYSGGLGGQGAAVFKEGELVFGPHWAEIGPINQALKLLGVTIEPPARDEFETVGLHLHRDAEGWLERQ